MITSAENELLRSHAYQEVIWRPIRHQFREGDLAMRICAARRMGAKLPTLAGDSRGWKRSQFDRDALAAKGFWQGGTITQAGKLRVRSLVWLTDRLTAATAVQRIQDCVERDWCRKSELVPECFIVGHNWGGDSAPFADLQVLLLPALIDGWLQSASTVQGHAFYRLAPGTDINAAVAETMPADTSEFSGEHCERYNEHVQQLSRMLVANTLKIETGGELGEIPQPVGVPLIDESQPYDAGDFGPLFSPATPATT